jgi:hypothetical protein
LEVAIVPEQKITLRSRIGYGRRVPAVALAPVFEFVPAAVRQSVRMRFEGRSRAKGKQPGWLRRAADIRFIGIGGEEETVLTFECPTLGESARSLYGQQELWPSRPDSADTGFDLLADVLRDIADAKTDSDLFDRKLLDSIAGFRKLLNGTFHELTVGARRDTGPAPVTPALVETARRLHENTPLPQRVRLIGRLDMLRISTRSFGLALDDGQEVRGVLLDADAGAVSSLMDRRVLVLGRAVYRTSGRLLRVDAETVEETDDRGSFFSAVPEPVRREFDLNEILRKQGPKPGVAAVFGKWPGDETDDVISQALRDMS